MKTGLCIFFVCVAFLGGWTANGWRIGQEIEELKNEHAQELIKAQKDAMRESVRRIDEAERIANETRKEKEQAVADARTAELTAQRLRNKLDAYSRSSCPTSHERSTTAGTSGDLCAELFNRIDDAAGELASFADRSRIAGMACEKQYESLRK